MPKTQIFAENRRFWQIHPFSWNFQHLEGAGNRRKPQIFAGTEDFRRNRRKPQIGLRHLRCVTFSSALSKINVLSSEHKEHNSFCPGTRPGVLCAKCLCAFVIPLSNALYYCPATVYLVLRLSLETLHGHLVHWLDVLICGESVTSSMRYISCQLASHMISGISQKFHPKNHGTFRNLVP